MLQVSYIAITWDPLTTYDLHARYLDDMWYAEQWGKASSLRHSKSADRISMAGQAHPLGMKADLLSHMQMGYTINHCDVMSA